MYSVDIDRQFSVTGNESTHSGECTLIENKHYVSSYQVEHYVV